MRSIMWNIGLPVAVLAAGLAAGAALAADAGPADIVVAGAKKLKITDLSDAAWQGVPSQTLTLTTAPPVHPAITGEAKGSALSIQAAATKGKLFVRVQWPDPSTDKVEGLGKWTDGVAIQLPMNGDADASTLMGGDGKMVNIWYWSAAANSAETLVADGFGTLTKAGTQAVEALGKHEGGRWTVVFQVPRNGNAGEGIDLNTAGKLPVAFAVWDGGNGERDGFKAVTMEWQKLSLH